MTDAPSICAIIASGRFDLTNEAATQADLHAHLVARLPEGVACEREVRLSAAERPDILVDGEIAIEVKIKGARKASIWRQLKRYAEHDAVRALILVTNVSMGLPPTILGKPAYYVSLGRAWL